MLVQLTTNQMIVDPCYHEPNRMIDFGGDTPRVVIRRNNEKSLDWHLKKAKAFLVRKKIKGNITDSQYTRSSLPPEFSGFEPVISFDFDLQGVIPVDVNSASGVPVDHNINEDYCFNGQWPAVSIKELQETKEATALVNWFLRLALYVDINRKLVTKAKRGILKQLNLKVNDSLDWEFYWIGR